MDDHSAQDIVQYLLLPIVLPLRICLTILRNAPAFIQQIIEILRLSAPNASHGDPSRNPHSKKLLDLLGEEINEYPPGKPYNITLDTVPVTIERMPYWPKEGDRLVDPGTARVNIAASNESPEGTTEHRWAEKHRHMSVVQQHCSYWDPDGDGVIWPLDTYRGCRRYGWNPFLSALAMGIINLNLSYATSPTWVPDPFFRIHQDRMHKNKHGSDSMTYDNEGRFMPQRFEDIFAKYDRGNKGGLDVYDVARFCYGQRMAADFFGWSATFLEWLATYLLIWPEDGIMRKEDIRRVYDGSLFQFKADEHQAKLERARRAKARRSKLELM